MAFFNLLKANYQGRLGETVGEKWKNISVVKSYTKNKDPKTSDQLTQRKWYKNCLNFSLAAMDYMKRFTPYTPKDMNLLQKLMQLNYWESRKAAGWTNFTFILPTKEKIIEKRTVLLEWGTTNVENDTLIIKGEQGVGVKIITPPYRLLLLDIIKWFIYSKPIAVDNPVINTNGNTKTRLILPIILTKEYGNANLDYGTYFIGAQRHINTAWLDENSTLLN